MSMLFDAPLIAGLSMRRLMGEAEERALIERLVVLRPGAFRFHGWLGNRKTQSFGWRYEFDDSSFAPTAPIPGWLEPAREKASAFAVLAPGDFAHVLLARYDPGAGIGWHRDRDVFEEVVGISLGAAGDAALSPAARRGFRRAGIDVAPRSAYLLSGEARHDWEHSIAPGDNLRFSITFRAFSAKGRRVAADARERPDAVRFGAHGRRLFCFCCSSRAVPRAPQADLPSSARHARSPPMGPGQ